MDLREMSDKLPFVDETRHRRNLKARNESDKLKEALNKFDESPSQIFFAGRRACWVSRLGLVIHF